MDEITLIQELKNIREQIQEDLDTFLSDEFDDEPELMRDCCQLIVDRFDPLIRKLENKLKLRIIK